jgi:hypothetical protein
LPALNTMSEIKGNLAAGEFVEAWHHLKGWYQSARACPETLASQTAERVELYMAIPPLGGLLTVNVTLIADPDEPLMDPEIQEVVAKLQNGCAAGMTGMKAVHLKEWLCGIRREEAEECSEGSGDCWRLLILLIQATWESSTMPTQMSWVVILLLPKGGGITIVLACLTPCGRLWRRLWWLKRPTLSSMIASMADSHAGVWAHPLWRSS